MRKSIFENWYPAEILLSLFVLALLIMFTFGIFFVAPYSGFYFDPSNGRIIELYVKVLPTATLQIDDVLEQIGPLTWTQYHANGSEEFFKNLQPGQSVDIIVKRNGLNDTVPWTMPGFNQQEFAARFFNIWWLPYIFWFFGMTTQFFMRPKDLRWRLLVASNYLTGLLLIVGGLSSWRIWESSVLLHALTWLVLPVYLRLHWIFPKPLERAPRVVWLILYLASCLVAIGELLQLLPRTFYFVGFFLMFFGSMILLVLHFVRQSDRRREVGFLVIAILIAVGPSIILAVMETFGRLPPVGSLALLALPIMPAAYFYAVYRQHLDELELRANRILSVYSFLILLFTILLPLALIVNLLPISREALVFIAVTTEVAAALISILAFPVFQAFVEKHFLGIRLSHQNFQEIYSTRVTTSTSLSSLERLLKDEVLPSLFVRQFAFLQINNGAPHVLFTQGIAEAQVPSGNEFSSLVAMAGKYRPPDLFNTGQPFPWVRLVLSLSVGNELIGFWLLGRRDPDDTYSQAEIPIFQSLANYVAIAQSNILQTERVKALYLANIGRYEEERLRLALELHDSVLNQMAVLLMNLGDITIPRSFQKNYDELSQRLREIVSDLRPPMLNYGLKPAFEELADKLMERNQNTDFVVDIQTDDTRYSVNVEQHLYRIAQEACENALRHGQARQVVIAGNLDPKQIRLEIKDNGVGFDPKEGLEMNHLLANKHFGLAGIMERGRLIDADVSIESAPNLGTRIQVIWVSKNE